MKTAVIYARYSSDKQSEQSIEGQLRVCNDYAQRNNITVVDTYIDRAMTGKNDNRAAFQKMLKDSARKNWDLVLIYKIDRFGRNKYEIAVNKHTLKMNGTRVISVMENIPDTPEGIILESLLEGMAEYYSAELSQKVKRGMRETRLKGNFTGGSLVYGYKVVDHKVVVNEEEAEVVNYIFSQFAMGVYVKDIMEALKQKGITNRNKPFSRSSVYYLLQNEKYAGIYHCNDEIYYDAYPRIVPEDIYNKVRARTKKKNTNKRSKNVKYLLKGKLICGYCNKPITAETGTSSTGTINHYYKCSGRKNHNGCKKTNLKKEFLEEVVINTIIKQLKKPEFIDYIIQQLLIIQDRGAQSQNTIILLKNELTKIKTSLNNVMKAIENGIINSTTQSRMQELEQQQKEIEEQIIIEQSQMDNKISENELRKYFKDVVKLKIEPLIEILIKEIISYNDKINIVFNTPIKTSPDNNQDLFFLYSEITPKNRYQKQDLTINLCLAL